MQLRVPSFSEIAKECPSSSLETHFLSLENRIREALALFREHSTLMDDLRELCRFGERLSNENEKLALEWLKNEFVKAGLKVSTRPLIGMVSVPIRASLSVNGKDIPALTHPMTPSVKELDGEVCFVENETTQVNGKIALLRGLATEKDVSALEARGAKAAIFITGPLIHNMIVSKRWGSPTLENIDNHVHIPVVSISKGSGDELLTEIQNSQPLYATLSTTVDTHWEHIANLEANLPPTTSDTSDFILLTGHLDSWGPGALDNASGLVTMLNIARELAKSSIPRELGLRIVIWSGHSHGRYAGSASYADVMFDDLSRYARLHINVDCLGGEKATLLSLSPAMASTAPLARFALKVGAEFSQWEGTHFSRSCDQSFWGMGIPSLFSQVSELPPVQTVASKAFGSLFGSSKSGGYGDYWHTREDTPEHISEGHLLRDASVFYVATLAAMISERLPLDVQGELHEAQYALRQRQEAIKTEFARDNQQIVRDFSAVVIQAFENLQAKLKTLSEKIDQKGVNETKALSAMVRFNYAESSLWKRPDTVNAGLVASLDTVMKKRANTLDEKLAKLTGIRREMNVLFHLTESII